MASDKKLGKRTTLEVINDRLAELKPEHYIAPGRKRDESVHVVGTATDHMRRLLTLTTMVVSEHNENARKAQDLHRQIQRATDTSGNTLDTLRRLVTGGLSADTIDQYKEMARTCRRSEQFHKLVAELFWLEALTRFDELTDKQHLVVCDDWAVGWLDVDDDDYITVVLGAADRGMPHLLRAIRARAQ